MTSAIKYKLKLTLNAEVLFGILSKLLPFEDFEIEEMVERSPQPPKQIAKSKPKQKRKVNGPSLKKGLFRIILKALDDGMGHHTGEFKKLVAHAGYSEDSVQSRLA